MKPAIPLHYGTTVFVKAQQCHGTIVRTHSDGTFDIDTEEDCKDSLLLNVDPFDVRGVIKTNYLLPEDRAMFAQAEKACEYLNTTFFNYEYAASMLLSFEPLLTYTHNTVGYLTRFGIIRIAMRDMTKDGKWARRPYSRKLVMQTVAHEVAHLQHDTHDKKFYALEAYFKTLLGV